MLTELVNNIWTVYLDTALWLLVGLLAAGMIKTLISQDTMMRWVGGRGLGSISRAALFGAPLPLCSCGVLPVAIGMHRSGASKEATVSFLVSTPETSVDSVAVTYALMGPLMAVVRPVTALINAIGTGLLTSLVSEPESGAGARSVNTAKAAGNADAGTACCASTDTKADKPAQQAPSCCSPQSDEAPSCCGDASADGSDTVRSGRLMQVLRFAGAELLDDISRWLAIGIVLAGIMLTFIPPGWLAQWGSGLSAMLIMLVVGIPMYICAVASTPVAAGLLLAGVSPGAVLVFLLVGPATNVASFALIRQELGLKVTIVYLLGLSVLSLLMGLSLEWFLAANALAIEARIGHEHGMLPEALAWASAFVLLFLAIKPLRRRVLPQLG